MEQNRYDAIVVGGGIAGLTAATYLARSGRKTLLVEKNDELGGLVNSFERDGFVFDAGVRAILDAGVVMAMLKDLGISLEFVSSKVSLGVEDRIIDVDDMASIDAYQKLLSDLYPDSTDEITKFIKTMRKIMKHLDVLYGIENPLFKDVKKDREYLMKTLLPWLPKFLMTIGKINRLSKPSEDYLKEMIENPSLVDIISQHFFKRTPTFFALSYFTLYLSYLYPKGGIGKLSAVLVEKLQASKGDILKNNRVVEIDAQRRFVVDGNNNRHYYDNLVWAADLTTFYDIVRLGDLEAGIQAEFQRTRQLIGQGKPGESIFALYMEVDLPTSYFKNVSHGHFFYTPSKEGLGDIHRRDLATMLDRWADQDKESVFAWLDAFLQYNTYEISIPALRDPSLAPAGKTGLMVSLLVEYELFEKLRASGWDEVFGSAMEGKIIDILSGTVYPGLKDKIEKRFSFTPFSIEKRVGSAGGAIVGWSFESVIPVVHKMQDVSKSVLTPIPNIYQAGQWAYNPAGLPTCIMTGKLAADKITK